MNPITEEIDKQLNQFGITESYDNSEKSLSRYVFGRTKMGNIHIIDQSHELGGLTVTNNAENVVLEVIAVIRCEPKTVISYRDTVGDICRLSHKNRKFTGFSFKSLEKDEPEAVQDD